MSSHGLRFLLCQAVLRWCICCTLRWWYPVPGKAGITRRPACSCPKETGDSCCITGRDTLLCNIATPICHAVGSQRQQAMAASVSSLYGSPACQPVCPKCSAKFMPSPILVRWCRANLEVSQHYQPSPILHLLFSQRPTQFYPSLTTRKWRKHSCWPSSQTGFRLGYFVQSCSSLVFVRPVVKRISNIGSGEECQIVHSCLWTVTQNGVLVELKD